MNHSKLLKLAKSLNKFSFDDLLILSESCEDEVKAFLDGMLSDGTIKQIGSDEYLFIKTFDKAPIIKKLEKQQGAFKVFKASDISDLIDPEKQKRDYKLFMEAPDFAKQKAIKYLLAFKAANNMRGSQLRNFISVWNNKYPEYKMAYSSFQTKKSRYIKEGIASLLAQYGNRGKIISLIPDDTYYRFRELYLSPNKLSANQCIELIKKEALNENCDAELNIPTIQSFLRRIKKEFEDSEIAYFRTMPMEIPQFIKPQKNSRIKKKQENKTTFETFNEAAEAFLGADHCKKLKPSTLLSYKSYIKSHLQPFFHKIKLTSITTKRVNEFRQEKIDEGLTASSINSYLDILRIILNIYAPDNSIPDSVKLINEKNYYQDMRILELDEVKKLLKTAEKHYTDFYPMLLTAISTGMTRGELLALTWSDIDFENNIIRVNKSLYRGVITKHRTKNSIRAIDITDDLVKVLIGWQESCPKGKDDIAFPNSQGEAQDPDNMIKRRFNPTVKRSGVKEIRFIDLRDVYASLLIKQNLQLTYIQEQLGHSSPQVTAERYKSLLDKQQVKGINILEEIL